MPRGRVSPGEMTDDMTGRLFAIALAALRRFHGDRGGAVAIIFAIAAIPLILAGLGAVDLSRQSEAKSRLVDALDAATLAAARSSATDPEEIKAIGEDALKDILGQFEGITLTSSEFSLDKNADGTLAGTVTSKASAQIKPLVLGVFGGDFLDIGANSTVTRAGVNIEVAGD